MKLYWKIYSKLLVDQIQKIQNFQHDYILISNSDLLTNLDYEHFFLEFLKKDADMSVLTIPYLVTIPYAVLETENDAILNFIEKPTYTYYSNGGVYLIKKNILNGIAYVQSTFNNTIISIADTNGNVISWASAGQKGFKGSRKSTPYAAQIAADAAASKAMEYGMKTLSVEVKGPGSGRETALRALQARGFKILSIKDTTPMPHNGVRPPKKRRV